MRRPRPRRRARVLPKALTWGPSAPVLSPRPPAPGLGLCGDRGLCVWGQAAVCVGTGSCVCGDRRLRGYRRLWPPACSAVSSVEAVGGWSPQHPVCGSPGAPAARGPPWCWGSPGVTAAPPAPQQPCPCGAAGPDRAVRGRWPWGQHARPEMATRGWRGKSHKAGAPRDEKNAAMVAQRGLRPAVEISVLQPQNWQCLAR